MKELKEHKEFIIKTSIVFSIFVGGLVVLKIAEEIFDVLFDIIGL